MTKSKPQKIVGKTLGRPEQGTAIRTEPATTDAAKSWREAIESIVIAIVLAFLFRAFEAEAFVIPTGSMAPTLQGRHKDVRCPECGYRYQAGASEDAEDQFGALEAVTCPMCHYTLELEAGNAGHLSNTGDRILVNKFAYEPPFGEPERWDVIVFKYPGNAKQNYIKRCVGLPNEAVKIHHGDIFVQALDDAGEPLDEGFHIARKSPRKLRNMLQLVHDTQYLSKELQQAGWPLNWQPAGSGPGWTSPDQGETYHCPATDDTAWLHFRLYYVDEGVWTQIDQNVARGVSPLENNAAVEMPVTDFYAYNAQPRRFDSMGQEAIGMHWVGDLAIEADVDVRGETGQLELVLVEAGRQHVCRIDVASGQATLRIDEGRVRFADDGGAGAEQVTAATPIRGAGRHRLLFANVDDQLSLWVDGRLCQFDQQPTYGPTLGDRPQWGPVDPGDMHPVRIGVRQAEVELRRCRVLRDIYYIATTSALGTTTDYPRFDEGRRVINLLLDPRRWQQGDLFDRRQTVVFKMQKDQFFPLGDNSPYSRDGRLWGREHFVERDMLIGEAVLIYWPHGWRIAIPGTGIVLPPIIPNVQKMGLIH